jgi:hypothetical protein
LNLQISTQRLRANVDASQTTETDAGSTTKVPAEV